MPEDQTFPRGEGGEEEEAKKADEARLAELDEEVKGIFEQEEAGLELAGPQDWWNIWARGPMQRRGLQPNRVIEVGEEAWIEWVVRLNRRYPINAPMQNACDIITYHGDKLEIFFFTSNTQTMQPVPALSQRFCIVTQRGKCYYRGIWRFRPEEPACIYETNICARICNCNTEPLPQYSGFVTWVRDWDRDWLFKYEPWTFDHPIRYMVADKSKCGPCPYP